MEIVMYLAACCTITTTVLALYDRPNAGLKRERKMMPGNENDQAGTWPF